MDNLNDMLSTPHNQATKEAWLRAIAIQLAQMNDTLAAVFFAMTPIEIDEDAVAEIVVELEESIDLKEPKSWPESMQSNDPQANNGKGKDTEVEPKSTQKRKPKSS